MHNDSPEEMSEIKESRAAEKFVLLIWHMIASLVCYWLMKDYSWVPSYLGGPKDGAIVNGFVNMPFTPMATDCFIFGLILLGEPLQATFIHFFVDKRKKDFAEMSLHHIAHLSLGIGYLMANMIPIGTLIIFLHEFSDIGVSGAKAFDTIG